MKKAYLLFLTITLALSSCKSSKRADLGDGLFADIQTSKGDIIVKLFVLLLILAGCTDQIDVSCTNAHLNDGWLHIKQQQIQVDKIIFVTTPYKVSAKIGSTKYRIHIGIAGHTFWYDDDNPQACVDVLEKITRVQLKGEEL